LGIADRWTDWDSVFDCVPTLGLKYSQHALAAAIRAFWNVWSLLQCTQWSKQSERSAFYTKPRIGYQRHKMVQTKITD